MTRFLTTLLLIATAAAGGEVRVSLDNAAAHALRRNPSLAAARLRIDEARGRLVQSGRLANPVAELDLSRNVRAPEGAWSLALVQKFPVTARLRLEKAVSRAGLAAAEAEVRDTQRKLAAEARTLVVRWLGLRGQEILRERQLANSRELAGFTRKRAESGEASPVDASQVELESQQLETELLALSVERASLAGELRALLGLRAGDEIVVTGELPPLRKLPGRGASPESRPDFMAARHTAEAARQSSALARAQKWDDLGVGFVIEHERAEDAPEGFDRDTFAGLKLSLALPLWNNNSGRIAESAAAARRAELETGALALKIDAEAAAARDSMAALAKVVGTIERELLPKAAHVEEQLRNAYSSGQSPLPEVLRARDRRLTLERQRLDALRDFHLARIRHDAATGRIHR